MIELEIYPIRNWYTRWGNFSFNDAKIRNISYKELIQWHNRNIREHNKIRNISYKELIPNNSNPNAWNRKIRNISYKELIRHTGDLFPKGQQIRNISYKELILCPGSVSLWDGNQLEIYPIRNWYKINKIMG